MTGSTGHGSGGLGRGLADRPGGNPGLISRTVPKAGCYRMLVNNIPTERGRYRVRVIATAKKPSVPCRWG